MQTPLLSSGLDKKLKTTVFLLFFLYMFASLMKPISYPDTPWHLKTGEYIFLNRSIPQSDPFSFAGDKPGFMEKFVLSQYWLSQIFFYLVYRAYGTFGLVITKALMVSATLLLLWFLIKNKGFYISVFITGGVAFYVLKDFSGIRAELFTLLFTALVIFLVEKYKEKGSVKYVLPLPFLMVLWANMHGGFIYGVVLMLIYIFSEGIVFYLGGRSRTAFAEKLSARQYRYLLVFCTVSILISFANPNTYKAFLFAFTTHSQQLFYFIDAYRSPFETMKGPPSKIIYSFWFYLPGVILMMAVFVKRRNITPLLLLLFSLISALTTVRYMSLFAIVATASFRHIPFELKTKVPGKIRHGVNAVIIVFLTLAVLRAAPFREGGIHGFNDSAFYPVNAANFLTENRISGNIFSSYNKSAFLLFRLFPESRIYFDSRYIGEERVMKAFRIEGLFKTAEERFSDIGKLIPPDVGRIDIKGAYRTSGPIARADDGKDSKELLDDIGAEIIVHEAVNIYTGSIYPFILKLVNEDAWRLIYLDGNVMVFVREIPKFKDIIAQYDRPKFLIYDEIILESMKGYGENLPDFYSSVALAMLLKGTADDRTDYFIDKALGLAPDNITANYCKALYMLMSEKKAL